ncbi:hypothetical protein GCM10022226_40700 [Sphaerisporangium flaviroseum]|uniref:Mersacidin/lichenicidin family type 2 lantibiotic n=1 Tax=Sphaerisporangium flaviroseum TaxID=509199 RepID=A0ABP7IDL6_9ACTN
MSEVTTEQAARIIAGWRSGVQTIEGWESPAGPLFALGEYAEGDITMESILAASGCTQTVGCPGGTAICGTACTYSASRECC